MSTRPSAYEWIVLAGVGIFAVFLLYGVFGSVEPSSLRLNILAAIVLASFVIFGAALLARRHSSSWPHFSAFAQGLASVITIVALFIAAGIYFAERRDKPKIAFSVTANAIALPREEGKDQELLLTIQVPVENTGAGRVEVECMSLALSGLAKATPLRRAKETPEEMEFETFRRSVNYLPDQACNTKEEDRKKLPRNSVRPFYRWTALALEPGEVDDKYFETTIPCGFSMVRLLVKARVNSGDKYGYESKVLVPLTGVCRGDKELVSGISAPTQAGQAPQAASDRLESNTQSPPPAR